MRLLHFDSSGKLTSTDFSGKTIPPYAILSHTWSDDEFLFENLVNSTGKDKDGYKKILFCNEQAACDHLEYFWVDTCCIDKWNLRELSDTINSMFIWYRNAVKCYVFLTDVSTYMTNLQLPQNSWEASFRKSRWFTRGWTLQELIAPASVEFFSSERQRLGDKESLEQQISEITRIPVEILRGDPPDSFSINERKSWMIGRETTQQEDIAYSLIGIFGVSMEFRYGEGEKRALSRLEEEIGKVNTTLFIVPFDQNVRFVGRESQLAELEGKLFIETSITRVAVTGPGGIGKTQLVLELAYRIRQDYRNCSVFWIPTSDLESLHQAYMQIAQRLNIPGWDTEKADVKKLVQLHLSKESTGQWLLVFDNVEDSRLGTVGLSKVVGLTEYLPSSRQGVIVFTTTDRNTAVTLASQNIVELPEIEENMAQKILSMSLIDLTNEQGEADLLVQELAYLPLAIVQAAAYINVNKITLRDYLSLLAEKKEEIDNRIREEFDDEGQYRSIRNPVATTWLISFEQIRSRNKLAADYLFFMACIDRKDIPLALLPMAPLREEIDAVETLNAYSFITKRPAESALDLHRLVHLAIRHWLQKQGLLSQETQVAITRLLEVFPDDKHGNRSKWRRLLPHAKYALSSDLTRQKDRDRTDLVRKCAMTLYNDGRFYEAEAYFQEAVQSLKRLLGQEHTSTLTSMGNLALTYWNQGRWKEAEELQVQVMETSKMILGLEHPDTLTSMGNMALTYWDQGRWKEAEELELQVMETRKRVLGLEHPHTLLSKRNLASTYWNQGRWKEAEELQVQAMKTSKMILGLEHPDTLISMSNMASTYRNQGRWKEAEELEVLVMETRKRMLGLEHPDTLLSKRNLASTYWNQGRWKEAEELQVQAMKTSKMILGLEHPDTLISMSNMASIYRNQGRWKKAEELEVQVMETRKRVLGLEHPSTLTSMANLASTYRNQGRWKEAEELEVQVMEMRKRVLGQEHPDTIVSMGNIALTYQNQGRWKEAEELEVLVMETRKRVLGLEHPDTLLSMVNLASTHRNQGLWKEAEEFEVQVMESRKRVLGLEHPSTLNIMGNLALTYLSQGRWKEAKELQVQTMETSKRVLGLEHPSTLNIIGTLASTYRNQGRWKEAEELQVQVMGTSKRVLGREHPSTLIIMNGLALTYQNQGRWKEAEELEVQVMETRNRVLGLEHPDTLLSKRNLASIYWNQGRWKEAEELQVLAMKTSKMILGLEHPSTLTSMGNLALTYQNQRRWKEAEELELQVMEMRKRALGLEHPYTLISMGSLAMTYQNQGRRKEAEELQLRVMETRKRILGLEHPDTLTGIANESGVDVLESRTMERGLRATGTGDGDEEEGTGLRTPFYAEHNRQSGVDVLESRAMEGGRRAASIVESLQVDKCSMS